MEVQLSLLHFNNSNRLAGLTKVIRIRQIEKARKHKYNKDRHNYAVHLIIVG